jgi:hypothetical protein
MLEKNKYKVVCDIGSCKNIAPQAVNAKGFLRNAKFNICDECLKNLYEEIAKIIVPKSPKNMVLKSLSKRD